MRAGFIGHFSLSPAELLSLLMRTRFEHAEPILNVRDMSVSLTYYVEVLGFKNAEWGGDEFTHISRDGAGIYLCQGDQGQPGTWVWIGVEDVAALYEEYKGERRAHPHASRKLSLGL